MPPVIPLQDCVFDVAEWARDEEYEVYRVGSRPKELLVSPHESPSPVLKPSHRYLFKESSKNYPAQYWAEVIAHRIGQLAGVIVPPAFAARDSRTGRVGTLIEWFYPYPETAGIRFVHGGDYLKRLIPDFDFKTGRQHNLANVLRFLRILQRRKGLQSPVAYWSRVFAFDALIGNTDRHQDNWGLVWAWRGSGSTVTFAPAFDNGTSLGHELLEERLEQIAGSDALDRYISRGTHHMRWQLGGPKLGHFEMLERFVAKYPVARRGVREVAAIPVDSIAAELEAIATLADGTEFTRLRSHFVLNLTTRRHALLRGVQ